MKLLIISKIFPNHLSPAFGTFVFNETLALARKHEVRVIAPVPWFPKVQCFKRWSEFSLIKPSETLENLNVAHPRYVVFPKIGRSLYGANYILGIQHTVAQTFENFKFAGILAHYAYPDGYAAAHFARKYSCPLLLKTHGSDIHQDVLYPSRRIGVLKALHRADQIIPVSRSLKQKIEELGIHPSKVKVIHNGIDTEHFKVRDQQECRRELGIPPDEKILLFVGQLVPIKGVLPLLSIFKKFIDLAGPQMKLVLVGSGELEGAVRQKISANALDASVSIVGSQTHAQIPKWMNAADILCLNSLNEGYPTVLIEAQACGIPIISTDVGGVSEIIQNQGVERLVPAGNEKQYVKALTELFHQIYFNRKDRKSRYSRTWDDVAGDITQELEMLIHRQTD